MKNKKEAVIFEIGDTVLVKWTKKKGIILNNLFGRFQVSTESPNGEFRVYELHPEEMKLIEKADQK